MLLLSQTEEPRIRIADYPPREGPGRGRKKAGESVEGAYGSTKKKEMFDRED